LRRGWDWLDVSFRDGAVIGHKRDAEAKNPTRVCPTRESWTGSFADRYSVDHPPMERRVVGGQGQGRRSSLEFHLERAQALEGMKAQESSELRRCLKYGATQQRIRIWIKALKSSCSRQPTAGGQGTLKGRSNWMRGESSEGQEPQGRYGMKQGRKASGEVNR